MESVAGEQKVDSALIPLEEKPVKEKIDEIPCKEVHFVLIYMYMCISIFAYDDLVITLARLTFYRIGENFRQTRISPSPDTFV